MGTFPVCALVSGVLVAGGDVIRHVLEPFSDGEVEQLDGNSGPCRRSGRDNSLPWGEIRYEPV
jgi:hypothetical protein